MGWRDLSDKQQKRLLAEDFTDTEVDERLRKDGYHRIGADKYGVQKYRHKLYATGQGYYDLQLFMSPGILPHHQLKFVIDSWQLLESDIDRLFPEAE